MKKYKITVNGNAYEVEVEELASDSVQTVSEAPKAAPQVKPASNQAASVSGTPVKSPMPGTILKVKASLNSSVKKGDVLVVLEAMKMENDIVAPCDGTVKSLNIAQGQSVNTGDVLAVLG